MMHLKAACAALLAVACTSPIAAQGKVDPISQVLAATAGNWTGKLQYRDYGTNQWEGLPVKIRIAVQPDGVTLVRSAAFDDGPKVGTVWITTISQFDPARGSESYASFRKGRELDTGTRTVAFAEPPRDQTHWTMVTLETRIDGNSPAQVRETTTRDGASMITLKEVNPLDDDKDEWLPRNRTVLVRSGR
ncbi:MAG: hypothetical protein WBL74_11030 [Novosphingobium sp.]|uniref:hypothetical protein n=1 Tax=Novosphingobium sp. TaxID=1874826 RepID=UPI003C7B4CEB